MQSLEDIERPHSLKSEAAVIGSCLLMPDVTDAIELRPEMFFSKVHSNIWKAILEENGSGAPWDATTLAKRISDAGMLDAVGGYKYLTELQDHALVPAHSEYYAQDVREKYKLRRVIEIAADGIDLAMAMGDPDEINAGIMSNLAAEIVPDIEELEMDEYVAQYIDDCENMVAGTYSWWCPEWDQHLGKMSDELMILHAPRSTGKTAIMMQWITEAHRSGSRAGLCSIEMLRKKIAVRLLSYIGKVNTLSMRRRSPTVDELNRSSAAKSEIRALKLCVRDKKMTIDDIRAFAIKESKTQLDALFIDNLLSINSGTKKFESKTIMYDYFIRQLRDLRDTLQIPIILLAHPNQEGGIAWSKDVENFADIILYLREVPVGGLEMKDGRKIDHRPQATHKHIMAIFQKNRDGEQGEIAHLDFNGEFQTFTHLEWD